MHASLRCSIPVDPLYRLAYAGAVPGVGSIGNPVGNALGEQINRLHKAEVIHRPRWWSSLKAVDWFNNRGSSS